MQWNTVHGKRRANTIAPIKYDLGTFRSSTLITGNWFNWFWASCNSVKVKKGIYFGFFYNETHVFSMVSWFQGRGLVVQLGSFYGINQIYFAISKPLGMEICFLESGLGLYVNKSIIKRQISVTKKKNGVPWLFLATSKLLLLGSTNLWKQVKCCDNFPEAKWLEWGVCHCWLKVPWVVGIPPGNIKYLQGDKQENWRLNCVDLKQTRLAWFVGARLMQL